MKLFVSDFDRTLYVEQAVSEANWAAVKAWQAKGNLFAIATGRHRASIAERLRACDIAPDYWICNNGGDVYARDFAPLAQICMESAVAHRLISALCTTHVSAVGVSTAKRNVKILGLGNVDDRNGDDSVVPLEEAARLRRVIQVAQKYPSPEETQRVAGLVNASYGAHVTAYPNVCNLDIVAKGVNKAEAVELLLRHLPKGTAVITAGDSYNDIEMLRRYGGYTLHAANPQIRAVASGVREDVASVIREHL